MKYTVFPELFDLDPDLKFGIVIGKDIVNGPSDNEDISRLRRAEEALRELILPEGLKTWPSIAAYREIMSASGINPNKFPISVEAMVKRVLKGNELPAINALVDLCNAVALEQVLSLGAHDLNDIEDDLEVRYSRGGERFLPFGGGEEEVLETGELIFTGGNQVQTRKWIWRQSELGKTTEVSKNLIFQIVGFGSEAGDPLVQALEAIKTLVEKRFSGKASAWIVDSHNPSIDFDH
jgi:DNA/RNA-binding domain of Phe-tRNA-synthetase-like protein